jgi:hypothetical protein
MRDAEETFHFPIRHAASHRRADAIHSIGSKLSLQRGANFREGMGNGPRLGINRNDGHKPKTRKKIIL